MSIFIEDISGNGKGAVIGGIPGGDFVQPSVVGNNIEDDTAEINAALASGQNVYLPNGYTYKITAPLVMSTNGQQFICQGELAPVGNIDCVRMTGGAVGMQLDITVNAPAHTGTVLRIDNASRSIVRRLLIKDAFSVAHIQQANSTVIAYCWASVRGKGITWKGTPLLRSDLLHIDQSIIDCASTEYGLDWDGNCHSLEVQYLGLIGCKGVIIQNTEGDVNSYPAIGKFGHIEIDYPTTHGIDITAGLDYDFSNVYVLGAVGSGMRVGAAINNKQVRIANGKLNGSTRYGIEALGGTVLFAGSTELSSNALGPSVGSVVTSTPRLEIDTNMYMTLSSSNPLIVFDANDYQAYDRSNNTMSYFIGGNPISSFDNNRASYTRPVNVPVYTVANLPAVHLAGDSAFASNGRKPAEGAAAGTGVPVTSDGTAWRRADGTTVLA